jgi:hypothetical protein
LRAKNSSRRSHTGSICIRNSNLFSSRHTRTARHDGDSHMWYKTYILSIPSARSVDRELYVWFRVSMAHSFHLILLEGCAGGGVVHRTAAAENPA